MRLWRLVCMKNAIITTASSSKTPEFEPCIRNNEYNSCFAVERHSGLDSNRARRINRTDIRFWGFAGSTPLTIAEGTPKSPL